MMESCFILRFQMSTAAATPGRARLSKEVWLLSGGHCFTHWYPATFFILLPILGKELGLSYTEIVIMTVQYLAGAITNLPGGILVDAVGKKGYLMATSLFWVGVPYALMALTHNYWMLLVCVTLVGIGNNLWHPTAIPTLANRYSDRKGFILALHGMGGNVGEAIAPLFIGLLLTYMSWRAAVIVNVIPGAIMATLILVMLGAFAVSYNSGKPGDPQPARLSAREYLLGTLNLLRNRGLMLISVSSGFRIMTQIGLLTFLPAYLAYELGYSPWAVGLAMTLLQIAGFIATPVGGHLSDKMGRKKVVMASFGMTALLIVAMALAGRTPAFIVMVAILGFFLYSTRAVIQAWTIEETPRHLAATGIGVVFTLQGLGGAISPTIFGLIADTYDIFTAFYFLAGTIVVANCLIVFMPNREVAEPDAVTATR
jgi:MFS family permease